MLKVKWDKLSQEEKCFVNECIRASVLDIIRIEEVQIHIDEGFFNHSADVQNMINLAMFILPHKCNPICLVMTGPNKFTFRKTNYMPMNPQSGNTREEYIDLPKTMSIESLRQLEKFGIVEPLEFNEQMYYMKPFNSRW